MQTIMMTTMGFLSALTTGKPGNLSIQSSCLISFEGWWGHFGERHGRTKVLALSLFGMLLTYALFFVIYLLILTRPLAATSSSSSSAPPSSKPPSAMTPSSPSSPRTLSRARSFFSSPLSRVPSAATRPSSHNPLPTSPTAPPLVRARTSFPASLASSSSASVSARASAAQSFARQAT